MTPESKRLLSAWRDEITPELTKEGEACPQLEAEHQAAITVAAGIEQTQKDLQRTLDDAFSSSLNPIRLADALALRSGWLREELSEARKRVGATKAALQNARDRIKELQRALNQIDHLLSQQEAEEAA
jgi:hypothetical protein